MNELECLGVEYLDEVVVAACHQDIFLVANAANLVRVHCWALIQHFAFLQIQQDEIVVGEPVVQMSRIIGSISDPRFGREGEDGAMGLFDLSSWSFVVHQQYNTKSIIQSQ